MNKLLLILFLLCTGFQLSHSQAMQDTTVYKVVEQMPSFPDGEAEMQRYISSRVDLSKLTKEDYIRQGRINIGFIVEADGTLSNIEVKTVSGENTSNAFAEVIKNMPKWIPGKHEGKNVRVYYFIPIHISLKQRD